jgi:hypothetical protein
VDRHALEAAFDVARELGVELDEQKLARIIDAYLDTIDERRQRKTPEEIALGKLSEVSYLVSHAAAGARETGDWQSVYDLIFDGDDCLAVRSREIADDVGWSFPRYVDPDAGYQEDAEAWIAALDEFWSNLNSDVTMVAMGR